MSSVGLGNWKKGSRVADSSMLTRNVKLTAISRGVTSDLTQLQLGALGIPRFVTPAAQTIQTVYKDIVPSVAAALNGNDLDRRRIKQ